MPSDFKKCLCKVSKGVIAYDTSFATSKVPFARTIATFRERSFKLSVVVLYKNVFMGFSGDAYIMYHYQWAGAKPNPKP